MRELAKRIVQRRKQLRLSQEELGFRVGTNQTQISRYERGENDLTGDVLVGIADALDTTTDYLLGRTDIPDRPLRSSGDLTVNERAVISAWRQGQPLEAIRIISDEGLKKIAVAN